jgi:ribonuclease G
VIDKIITDLERLIKKNQKKITLSTHPFIAAFLTKGFPSPRTQWFLDHKRWVKILPRDAYTFMEYHFHDKDGEVLE